MHIVIILFFLMVSVCHGEELETVNQELDEVVVSASRVEEKVKEVPATINIVDSEELDNIKFRNPAEVLNRLPGIYSHDFGGESLEVLGIHHGLRGGLLGSLVAGHGKDEVPDADFHVPVRETNRSLVADAVELRELKAALAGAGWPPNVPDFACPRCKGELIFDDLPQRYFAFLEEDPRLHA